MSVSDRNFFIGLFFGGVGFLFFMVLIILSIVGYPVPCKERYLVVIFLSLLLAFAGAIISGSLKISGKIKIPLLKDHPMVFSATSGFALFLFVFLVGDHLYVKTVDCGEFNSQYGVINDYISQSKNLERDWLGTYHTPSLCNDMDLKISKLVKKLDGVNSSEVSYETKIKQQFYIFRLRLFTTTIDKNKESAINKLIKAEQEFTEGRKLVEELMHASSKFKADKDWYINNQYEGIFLINEVFLDVLRFKLMGELASINKASLKLKILKSKHSSLMGESEPMENQYWEVVETKIPKHLRNTCVEI